MIADAYFLDVDVSRPRARLSDPGGRVWSDLSLLASVDLVGARDQAYAIENVAVHQTEAGDLQLWLTSASSCWRSRVTVLTCLRDRVELSVSVTGDGVLDQVTMLGGRASLASGACGAFHSGIAFASVFDPTPTQPVQVVRPAASPIVLGIVGDADAGRLNAVFSPPPMVLAFGRGRSTGPTETPEVDWLGLSVRALVEDLTFTQLHYRPADGGFDIMLDYDGHTRVSGSWTSPTLVLRPAADVWQTVRDHRDDLVSHGLAQTRGAEPTPRWWLEPIFCGWGAQCARASRDTDPMVTAPSLARQQLYDEWLDRLSRHDLSPGTVVIDDRWQAAYGTMTTDENKWPDLRGWIADQHRDGRRVLLWWKAWDPEGLPAEECIVDPSGRPVAVDPTSPTYRQRVINIVTELLSPEGLDADGFKIDFTQRAPMGSHLNSHGEGWGIALLHRLLESIFTAAKQVKPDALMITHTPHPSFGNVTDMVRLNDVLETGPDGEAIPVVDQLRFRHAVAQAALPDHPIDTDQWPMPDRREWLAYASEQANLGVPALYYLESIDNSGEEISSDDLVQVAESWRVYRDRLVGGAL